MQLLVFPVLVMGPLSFALCVCVCVCNCCFTYKGAFNSLWKMKLKAVYFGMENLKSLYTGVFKKFIENTNDEKTIPTTGLA